MDDIRKETYYGVLPITTGERIYGFRDILLIAAGYGIATWCFVQGAWVSSLLPFYLSIIITLTGIILFAIPTFLVTVVPSRYGCDIWIYQRAIYGYKLNFLFLIFALTFSSGWDAINARIFADVTILVINTAGGNLGASATPWFGSISVIIGFLIAMAGPIAVRRTTYIIVPILLVVGVFMAIAILIKASPSELNSVEPIYGSDYGTVRETFMYVLESNFAFCLSWFVALGILPRLVKSERSSLWGHILGMGFAMTGFIFIGIISDTYMGSLGIYSEDPTEALLLVGGPVLGVISLISIAFANISTQALEIYALSLATKVLKPNWNYRIIGTFWLAVVLFLTFSEKVWDYYASFVSLGGSIYAPAIAIFIVDFFILRRQRIDLKSLYMRGDAYEYSGGFNLVTVVAFAAGVATFFLLFDPVNYVAKSKIFFVVTATGGSFLVSGFTYLILGLIPCFRKYLLKDRESLTR